nr:integrase, catalytic region, zinc finger, CCHC-type, peptidase aspartic, catalytic [Tanacetum cinerariifolium]GEY10058.1 integrase, catalytic region, zinc finger, CCHC-type, peptidase aspartic, catalytic [Tanacetum cinerariifolium]
MSIEKNNDLLAQMNILQEQLKVKHVVIDTHVECQAKYAKLEAERYEYMIRYSAYFDNDKQHRKWIADQEILFDKMRCSKHMAGNRALLTNLVEKFLGTVRFGNNDFAVIAGYGDVVIGSMTIKKVYYVEGLCHNLFSVGQFCDKKTQVNLQLQVQLVPTDNGTEFKNKTLATFFDDVGISQQFSPVRTPQKMVSWKGEIVP